MSNCFIRNGKCLEHPTHLYRIRKRGEHRCWEVEFSEARNIWKSTKTMNIDEVENAVSMMLANDGKKSPSGMRFVDFAKRFFTRTDEHSIYHHNERMNKIYDFAWYESHQGRLDNYIMPMFGSMMMKDITDVMIEDWYIGLRSASNPERELADNSKIKVLNALKIIMKEAKRRRVIDVNPCDTVERINEKHVKRGYFTIDEVRTMFPSNRIKLIQIWGSMQWALFFSIMVDTGWRCGEVSALRKANFIDGGVYTTSSVHYRTGQIKNSIKTTKKGQSYKVGILSDFTVKLYEEFVKDWEYDEIFYLEEQKRLNRPDASNYALRRALKYLHIDDDGRTEHCLRHSFDTYMLNNTGSDINQSDVQELMAHTSYRPEYDHRTESDIINRLSKAKPILNRIREA